MFFFKKRKKSQTSEVVAEEVEVKHQTTEEVAEDNKSQITEVKTEIVEDKHHTTDPNKIFLSQKYFPDYTFRNFLSKYVLKVDLETDITDLVLSVTDIETYFFRQRTGQRIGNIDGIQYFKNLKYLELDNNEIDDLTPIQDLVKLEYLRIVNNHLTDISPINKLTEMDYLCLDKNCISNISAISNLTRIRFLSLNHNRIENISAIPKLTKLQKLWLRHNYISDISSIEGVHHTLRSLLLSHNLLTNRNLGSLEKIIGSNMLSPYTTSFSNNKFRKDDNMIMFMEKYSKYKDCFEK